MFKCTYDFSLGRFSVIFKAPNNAVEKANRDHVGLCEMHFI